MLPMKMKRKNYTPYPGFYDLRIFNLNPKEFSAAWRVQELLYRQIVETGPLQTLCTAGLGKAQRLIGAVSNDPAAQAEAGRRASVIMILNTERT